MDDETDGHTPQGKMKAIWYPERLHAHIARCAEKCGVSIQALAWRWAEGNLMIVGVDTPGGMPGPRRHRRRGRPNKYLRMLGIE